MMFQLMKGIEILFAFAIKKILWGRQLLDFLILSLTQYSQPYSPIPFRIRSKKMLSDQISIKVFVL